MSKIHRATKNNADQFISQRLNFKTGGSLSGENRTPGYNGIVGRLPHTHHESFYASTYAVYSYATPIAWWSPENGWVRPEVRYSVTTSHHQGKCPLTGYPW